jgi:hypothetical protein
MDIDLEEEAKFDSECPSDPYFPKYCTRSVCHASGFVQVGMAELLRTADAIVTNYSWMTLKPATSIPNSTGQSCSFGPDAIKGTFSLRVFLDMNGLEHRSHFLHLACGYPGPHVAIEMHHAAAPRTFLPKPSQRHAAQWRRSRALRLVDR